MPLPAVLLTLASSAGSVLTVLGKVAYITKVPELVKFGKQYMVPKKKTWVTLNVGGRTFMSTQATLMSKPNSVFALMLEAEEPSSQEHFQSLDEVEREKLQQRMNKWGAKGEEYRFDRDPDFFVPVLNYLRTGKLIYSPSVSLQGILEEARFYELPDLERLVLKEISKSKSQDKGLSSTLTQGSNRFGSYFDE